MHKRKELKTRILSALLSMAMVLSILPPMTLPVLAAETYTFSSGAVLLDESFSNSNVIIQNGVFSVTVSGAQNVNIIFDGTLDKTGAQNGGPDGKPDGITIDRRYNSDRATGGMHNQSITMTAGTYPAVYKYTNMYDVSQKLGWNGAAPVCPFLVTNGATVTASFRGPCTFYAGTTGSRVSANGTYTADPGGQGYAGIQVDSGSSLTIEYAEGLTVYGAHQLATPDANGKVGKEDYSMVLRANTTIRENGANNGEIIYENPYSGNNFQYVGPNTTNNDTGYEEFAASGGAGIGGGGSPLVGDSSVDGYTQGTPGTIIINGGTIEAFGGHAAAGIGGSINGAATKSMIQINGGAVTAHGGRWAAGIGDGDSVPNSGEDGPCPDFANANGLIEVNGGTVTAYGGVAAPGIGCTDEISVNDKGFGANATSKLQIAINGGAVNAVPGFPNNFTGSFTNMNASPAAIGAGASSQMQPNSIYISSEAELSCTGFGYYSLTENGVQSSTLPTINIDSDGYLLLLRTAENQNSVGYHSSETRTLKLYAPQTREFDDIGKVTMYVSQPGQKLHYVTADGIMYDENHNLVSAEDAAKMTMTLYVDENSVLLDTIKLDYYFRSLALTLPDPEIYGGLYALSIPTDGMSSNANPDNLDFITMTVEAHEQGTQSGWVDYPSGHNFGKDAVSEPLTDLDINGDGTIDGLIGNDFYPNVYGYTVYFPADATEVDLYAAFEIKENRTYSLKLDGTRIEYSNSGDQGIISETIDVSGVDEKTVRLSKQDSALSGVSYKITLIRMGDYNLELTDPSKIYDGQPAKSSADMVYEGTRYLYDINDVEDANSTTTTPVLNIGNMPTGQISGSFYCTSSGNGFWNNTYHRVNLTTQVSVSKFESGSTKGLRYILTVKASNNTGISNITDSDGYQLGWDVTFNEASGVGTVTAIGSKPNGATTNMTWVSGNSTQIATANNIPVNLVISNGAVRITCGDNNAQLFSIGEVNLTKTGSGTKTAAWQAVQNAIKSGIASGQIPYTDNGSYVWTQPIVINTVTAVSSGGNWNTTYSNNVAAANYSATYSYEKSGSGYYEFTYLSDDGEVTEITLPEEDLEAAVLTYYRQETDGTYTQLDGPPVDAGTYRVDGEIIKPTYTARGSRTFTIEKRPVTVLQIDNWLTYLTSDQVAELQGKTELEITKPGKLLLDNVVSGDTLTASADSVYYNDLSITYGPTKITLTGLTLDDGDGVEGVKNYYIDSPQTVFGQLAYDTDGAIFRKTEEGDWRKYYPVDNDDPVGSQNGPQADYHSPLDGSGHYTAHAEYVKARTVGNGEKEARYAVDIEYGPMQFGFYRGAWDVNQLAYVKFEDSIWTGMDGTNNKIVLTNYSNLSVWYQMDAEIDFLHADLNGTGAGITPRITTDFEGINEVESTTWSEIPKATAGNATAYGMKSTSTRYLMLSGVPQTDSPIAVPVGAITIFVSPTGPGSS